MSVRAIRDPNFNWTWARALAEELWAGLTCRAFVSPGSRSAPLALALARTRRADVAVVVDERAAGFAALGAALATQQPAAVVCTSGSAGAHYLPAVVEADASAVPLVVVTANRPPELHGCGAPQTTPQHAFFGAHVRATLTLPAPQREALPWMRTQVARALAVARGDTGGVPGPVHLDVPFREPLAPDVDGSAPDAYTPGAAPRAQGAPWVAFGGAPAHPDPRVLDQLLAALHSARRPVLVAGPPRGAPWATARAWTRWAQARGIPVVADVLSEARHASSPVLPFEPLWRAPTWRRLARPDLLLHVGAPPTAYRPWAAWREELARAPEPPVEIGVDPWSRMLDPLHRLRLVVGGSAEATLEALDARLAPGWRAAPSWTDLWRRAAALSAELVRQATRDAWWEGAAVAAAARAACEARCDLWLGSSMPVRDADAFAGALAPDTRLASNRGVNGIDGFVASAAGWAGACGRRVVAVCGDLTFLHDLDGLSCAPGLAGSRLTVVVVDNRGGGIFGHLPLARYEVADFDWLFRAAQPLDVVEVAQGLGWDARRIDSERALRQAICEAPAGDRPRVLVVPCDADEARARREELARAAERAVQETFKEVDES